MRGHHTHTHAQVAQHTKSTLQSEFLSAEPSYKVKMIAFSPKLGAPTPLLRRIATYDMTQRAAA